MGFGLRPFQGGCTLSKRGGVLSTGGGILSKRELNYTELNLEIDYAELSLEPRNRKDFEKDFEEFGMISREFEELPFITYPHPHLPM